jgi:hypothetical protein
MMRGKYIGSKLHLVGKTALLKDVFVRTVCVQFDDMTLTRSGAPVDMNNYVPSRDDLGFGWHSFSKSDFVFVGDEK